MGLNIGKVVGQTVGTYKGVDNIRTLQVELFGGSPETVVYMNNAGEDTAPVNGDLVIVREVGADKYTFGIKDSLLPSALDGEKRIYSRDSNGAIAALIHLKADGSIDISAPAGVNITGDMTVVGLIRATLDIIADYLTTAIRLLTHFHQGNLGFPTGAPIQSGGGTTPNDLPSTNSDGDIIDGSNINLSLHDHSQPNDSNGDSEGDTSAPKNP